MMPVAVMFDVPSASALTVIPVGLAAIVKSWATKVTVAECESGPLEPVRFTENPVMKPEQVRVDGADEPSTTLTGFKEHVGVLED